MPDWRVLSVSAQAQPFKITESIQVAGFILEFVAKRYFLYHLLHMIIPLLLIIMMSWTPFWVDPTKAELQFGIASSTVLTLIAYRLMLANLLPDLPYLTRLDYLSFGGTILVFLAFLQVLVTSTLASAGRKEAARAMDHWCRALFPVSLVALFVWSLFV